MKQVIILFAMIVLGTIIAGYIIGDGDNSVKSELASLWQNEIVRQSTYP